MRPRIPPARWWLFALIGVTTVGLAARLGTAAARDTLLLVDAITLMIGAAVVLGGVRRAPELSVTARRWQWILVAFFILGAIRAVLWRQGLAVGVANLVALGIATTSVAVWAIRTLLDRRSRSDRAAR